MGLLTIQKHQICKMFLLLFSLLWFDYLLFFESLIFFLPLFLPFVFKRMISLVCSLFRMETVEKDTNTMPEVKGRPFVPSMKILQIIKILI